MTRKTIKKTAYRLLAALLVISTLGANMVTLSYAGEEAGSVETICGLEEHTHIEGVCYEEKTVQICGMEEGEIHTHEIDCFAEQELLICELEACEPHTHDETCMETVETYLCGMEAAEAHAHGDTCYTEKQDLICGQTVCQPHTHTDGCYTLQNTYTCGQSEWDAHTHGEGCYVQETQLSCALQADDTHTHDDGCYTTEAVLTCTEQAGEGHSHSEACCTEETVLACQLEETEGHDHSENCYGEPRQELTCGQEETDGHTHTEDCVKTESVLSCGQEETEGHAHSEVCYETQNVQVCPHESGVPHVHGDACHETVVEMSCQMAEHVHSDECYAKPAEKELICTDPDHEHTDECYAVAEELVERSITDENNLVTVTGLLPETATVQARALTEEELAALPVPAEMLLFAYDITIWVDGVEYQTETPVQVTVLPKSEETESLPEELEVRHAELDAETLEVVSLSKVESVVSENGELTFEAESFSIYFATLPIPTVTIEKDVGYRVYKGEEAVSGELLWTGAMTLTVKANVGYEVTGVTVEDGEGNDTTATHVTKTSGVYTLTFAAPGAEAANQTVTVTFAELEVETITFDISKGNITLNDSGYSGKNSSGGSVSGAHKSGNRYIITQSTDITANRVYVGYVNSGYGTPAKTDYIIELQNVHVERKTANYTAFMVNNAGDSTVVVLLKDGTENYLYSAHDRPGLEKYAASTGTLVITCEAGYEEWLKDPNGGHRGEDGFSACDEDCGCLDARNGQAWNTSAGDASCKTGPGIGTRGNGNLNPNPDDTDSEKYFDNSLYNLTIAGGHITAIGGTGDTKNISGGAAGIGTGPAHSSRQAGGIDGLKITGGTIEAVRGDYASACIGGGYRAGYVNIDIYGGTINAVGINPLDVTVDTSEQKIRGPGIGGGGGGYSTASPEGATVNIYAGNITAFSQFGAAIGAGGGGSTGSGSDATVNIYGGTINATTTSGYENSGAGAAIGTGGSLGTGKGGEATVNIYGGTIYANSESGADIGGGGTNSSDTDGVGGNATVTITGGDITAENGGIGGGRANAGNGGEATVTITGGTVHATSIGGGDSKTGNGGEATVVVDGPADIMLTGGIGGGQVTDAKGGNGGAAEVYISDGIIRSGSIGGGSTANPNKNIGYATAFITGGDITAQFIMAAGGTDPCTFTMTGGTLHDNDVTVSSADYTYASRYGGAVFMDDPTGVVTISGGTIENCVAEMGGAVYMTAGTLNLSGTGVIQNCEAIAVDGKADSGNGGAIYMGGSGNAKINISGGALYGNSAPKSGGSIYMTAGTVTMSDGSMGNNTAMAGNGGAIYMGGGVLTVNGGTLSNNAAMAGNGGAIGMGGGQLHITGGSLTGNTAVADDPLTTGKGGGAYIENGMVIMSGGAVDGNSAHEGAGLYVSASADPADVGVKIFSGSISGNTAAAKGGAISVVGDQNANAQNITITVGVNELHQDTNADNEWDEIQHDANGEAAADGEYTHCTCPQIKNNQVSTIGGSGGALYLTGSVKADAVTQLNLFCLNAVGNDVAIPDGDNVPDGLSDFMKVDGGKVVITSSDYTEDGGGNVIVGKDGDKHGVINIDGSLHVAGGCVDMYGSIENPGFGDCPITVDVKGANDYFLDHRFSNTDTRTVTYVENFYENGIYSGRYTLYHVEVGKSYAIESGIYSHPGYQMVGWYTEKVYPTAGAIRHQPGETVTLSGTEDTEIGTDTNGNLTLYGIWEVFGYNVRFNINAPSNATVLGSSTPYEQHFTYDENKELEANRFKVQGYVFQGWSLERVDTEINPENPNHFTDPDVVVRVAP